MSLAAGFVKVAMASHCNAFQSWYTLQSRYDCGASEYLGWMGCSSSSPRLWGNCEVDHCYRIFSLGGDCSYSCRLNVTGLVIFCQSCPYTENIDQSGGSSGNVIEF